MTVGGPRLEAEQTAGILIMINFVIYQQKIAKLIYLFAR